MKILVQRNRLNDTSFLLKLIILKLYILPTILVKIIKVKSWQSNKILVVENNNIEIIHS